MLDNTMQYTVAAAFSAELLHVEFDNDKWVPETLNLQFDSSGQSAQTKTDFLTLY
jgi:hypothetical protein